ncbi:hypothetical protein [Kitasatospora sp. NPDC059088]|uniref:hypothetical protein n=1 Tax=unclassified Kitasatospora TaxID=2633591 RepID=UPI0036D1492E
MTATGVVLEGVVGLDFVGIDPETGKEGSPMVLLDNDKQELVIQGLKADDALNAEVGDPDSAEDPR